MRRAFPVLGWLLFASSAGCKSSSSHEAKSQPAPVPPTATAGKARDAGGEPITGPDDTGAAPATAGTDVATGRGGAVTSAEKHATAVGSSVLKKGGNAVDAVSYTHLTLPTILRV